MPLDPLLCNTTSDLAKLVRRRAVYGAVYDARRGGVDGRRLGMGDYLLTIAPVPISGNKARGRSDSYFFTPFHFT